MIDRDAKTLPPPAPDDLAGLMRDLTAALERTSELCVKVANRLTLVELAELTAEHRINVQTSRVDDHEQRLRALEGLLTDPPSQAMAAE